MTWILRRFVLAPLTIVLTLVLLTSLPLWLLGAALLAPVVEGRMRPLRLLWLIVVQLVLESAMLVTFLGLWIASGFGLAARSAWYERAHYVVARWYLVTIFREARRVLRLRILTVGESPDAHPGEPLLVCCRHAGPGDSFVLMYALMHWYDREPRVVLKDTLAWDPMVDVLLRRIPSRFISGSPGEDVEEQIADLARDLDENDAFVIFPEGGNFTQSRRDRAIASLRERGFESMADRAEAMSHVLAPRPGGFLAALEAAPDADVLLVAHTGLDHLLTVSDVWRELPMDKELTTGWWRVSRDDIPEGREAQIDWLFSWWEYIDGWIEEHRPRDLGPVTRRGGRG